MIFVWFAVLFGFLFLLLKSADYFVDHSVIIGNKLNIPSFVLGATVIAFGTSLPELAVSLSAIFKNTPEIISGTVIGSNVSNIFFILGVALVLDAGFKIKFKENAAAILILTGVTILISYFLWDNEFDLYDGIIAAILLLAYIVYIVVFQKEELDTDIDNEEVQTTSIPKALLFIVLSGVGIWAGAEMVIMAIQKIAHLIGIKEDIISLTVVALGTSLPELAVTIVAVRKKQYGIVLGNVIGSNVFNMLCVLSIPALVGYFTNHPYIIKNATFTNFSIPLMLLATGLLLVLSLLKSTSKMFGFIFIAFYHFFILGTFLKLDIWSYLNF